MKTTTILIAGVAVLALIGIGIRVVRLTARLDAMEAGRTRVAIDAPSLPADLRNAMESLASAQRQLTAAEARVSKLTGRIATLENQIQTLSTQVQRSPPGQRPPIPANLSTTDADAPQPRRAWGPEQVIGAPDTHQAGDISTAWASREPDGGEEWLHLSYSNAVYLSEVHVRETFNPGAISKVVAVLPNGQEMVIWEGVAEPTQAPVETVFPVSGDIYAQSVKVYLDTKRVPGWNEIDAVELVGRDGSRQWASKASASSTYAEPR